jgi:DNA-directed RNA polymerase specialized sigma subunit
MSAQKENNWDNVVIWGIQLKEILDKLKMHEREIFTLHFIVGYDLKKIATILEISHEAARQRWSRTQKSIQALLDPPDLPASDAQKGDDDRHA